MRAALLALLLVLAACGSGDPVATVGRDRADQARQAALDAGLDADVADFLALAAQGETATYRLTYPGPDGGSELVVTSRPPDRRVDLVVDGKTTESRLVLDGAAYQCHPDEGCERTDAFVAPPGVFTDQAMEDLRASLVDRAADFTFEIQTMSVAGTDARCLVTRRRAGHERPELGAGGTICLAPDGAVVLVDQGDERLEATDYTTEVDADVFELPSEGPDPG